MGAARYSLGSAGLQTAALAFGGSPGGVVTTEQYDGSSWTSTASLATARVQLAGLGTKTAGLATGGRTPSASNATEEFTDIVNEVTSLDVS